MTININPVVYRETATSFDAEVSVRFSTYAIVNNEFKETCEGHQVTVGKGFSSDAEAKAVAESIASEFARLVRDAVKQYPAAKE